MKYEWSKFYTGEIIDSTAWLMQGVISIILSLINCSLQLFVKRPTNTVIKLDYEQELCFAIQPFQDSPPEDGKSGFHDHPQESQEAQ